MNGLIAHTLSARINFNGVITQPRLAFLYAGTGSLEYKRTSLALRALEAGANYLLLVDWDHTFPPDALLRLAAHNLPFVAANYLQRHEERVPVAPPGQGVQQAPSVGLGFALVKSEVFSVAPKPWFQSHFDDTGRVIIGEDVHFCNQVRAAGIPVCVDHDLQVGHIAEIVLTMESANADSVLSKPGS